MAADDARAPDPAEESDILLAIDEGVLTETHYFDVKREVGKTDGERAIIARHLASLAIDGGALLIGLEENKQARTWTPKPQVLGGLPERIEQIASYLVDPPLHVTCREIPSADSDGLGYLLVRVPASPRAPHMVAGVYYGRGDRTRVRLSDAEVLQHHARRESIESLADRLLDQEADRDPQPDASKRQCGRLYAVAQPLTGSRQLARSLMSGSEMHLRRMLDEAEDLIPPEVRAEPSPAMLNAFSRRSHGVALSDHSMTGAGRTLRPRVDREDVYEERMLDLEIREDGGLRLLSGRLTADWGRNADDSIAQLVLDAIAVGYSLRMVLWATKVADLTGYRGTWVFGVHGTGMRGLSSSLHVQNMLGRGNPFDAEMYRETTTATYQELRERPQAVAERLVGRLVRALRTEQHWGAALGLDRQAG